MTKKLSARIVGSWSSYAGSAFGVVRDCGMWDFNREYYGLFLGLTGICFQTIYDKNCGAGSVTAYDWEKGHSEFLQRIGITTGLCCDYDGNAHPTVVAEVKAAVDQGNSAVLWGVDTGEFGVIYGYDDSDGVFLVSGIGGNDSNESNPILYQNIGSHMGNMLFCQFPTAYKKREFADMVNDSLKYYISHMTSTEPNYGLNAYSNLLHALANDCDSFGLRYTTGVYAERKAQAEDFINDDVLSLYKRSDAIKKAGEHFIAVKELYNKIHFEVLEQGFDGWNHLQKPVSSEAKKAIVPIVKEIVRREKEAVELMRAVVK